MDEALEYWVTDDLPQSHIKKLDKELRKIDRGLHFRFNRAKGRYEIWCRSEFGSHEHYYVMTVEDPDTREFITPGPYVIDWLSRIDNTKRDTKKMLQRLKDEHRTRRSRAARETENFFRDLFRDGIRPLHRNASIQVPFSYGGSR